MFRSTTSFLGATLLVAGLSGCTTTPAPDSRPGVCDSATLGWTIGQVADEALVNRAHAESGAKVVRVLRPGQVVTMEYSEQRLNLYVDDANKVQRYSCS